VKEPADSNHHVSFISRILFVVVKEGVEGGREMK